MPIHFILVADLITHNNKLNTKHYQNIIFCVQYYHIS